MNKYSFLIVLLFVIVLLGQCKHEVVEPEVPVNAGLDSTDTNRVDLWEQVNWPTPSDIDRNDTIVYYENDIRKLLITKCAMQTWHYKSDDTLSGDSFPQNIEGCHGPGPTHMRGDVQLDVFSGSDDEIDYTKDLIDDPDPVETKLFKKIADGEMPYKNTGAQLNPSEFDMLETWIRQGANENKCNPCDTSWSGTWLEVRELLYKNCSGCHNSDIINSDPTFEGDRDALSFFVPNNSDETKADYNKISSLSYMILQSLIAPENSRHFMPRVVGRLYECEVEVFKKWYENDAPEN